MPKTFFIRNGLTPNSKTSGNKEPVKAILSDFIKDAEKNFRMNSYNGKGTKSLEEDRRHVNDMLPFEGTAEMAMKGIGDYGFFTAIYECYNNHWGLRTIPDDWWYTIIRTVAIAIDKHSKEDEVRKYFVNHEGKKRLTVDVDDTCGIDYEKFFRDMAEVIQSNIKVKNYVRSIRSDFTTSTETHQIVSEITVMSSMQEFFEYEMMTMCGIPFVEMEGTEEDWVKLKSKVLELKKILQPIQWSIGLTTAWWMKIEVICDNLLDTYHGDGDKEWWSKIFSSSSYEGSSKSGDDPYTTYDGWFLNDLLNISVRKNKFSRHSFESIPSGLVSVPLIFNDPNGHETKGAIVSGIAGIKIDGTRKVPVVSSTHGWAIFR